MAKSWQYPRWRRIVMQGVLWIVLLATLGVAALVNYERRQALAVELSEPVRLGALTVRVPKDWKVAFGDGQVHAAVMQAHEPGEGGRVLTIEYQRARELVPPLQHLADNAITLADEPAEGMPPAPRGTRAPPELQRIDVGGWPGILIADLRPGRSALLPMVQAPRAIVAAAVLPSRDAVILRLDGVGPSPQFDQQLIRQVGQSITCERAIEPLESDVELIPFANGVRAAPPAGFAMVRPTDPNRLSRQLILDELPGRWTTLELIPCYFPADGDMDDLRSMLWARDDDWFAATVHRLALREWRADLPPDPRAASTARAYLVADELGHGLIAMFRGTEPDASAYDVHWETIFQSARFPATNPFPEMLATGDRAGIKMREQDLQDLLEGIAEEQWWLCLEENPVVTEPAHGEARAGASVAPARREAYLGWAHLQHFHDPDKWSTRRHSMSRQFDQAVLEIEHNAQSRDGTVAEHEAGLDLYSGGGFTARPDRKQVVLAQPGTLSLQLTIGRRLPPVRMNLPNGYLPGGWFSLLAGRLVSKPMIVKTDALLGYDGLCPPRLLTLIVEPGESRQLEATGPALRCMNVTINGTGQVARWYFDEHDELQRIESADGIVRRRSDRNEITSGFAGDRVLGRVGQDGYR